MLLLIILHSLSTIYLCKFALVLQIETGTIIETGKFCKEFTLGLYFQLLVKFTKSFKAFCEFVNNWGKLAWSLMDFFRKCNCIFGKFGILIDVRFYFSTKLFWAFFVFNTDIPIHWNYILYLSAKLYFLLSLFDCFPVFTFSHFQKF